MVAHFFYKGIELEQDAYGSAIFNLPDEVCHDLGLQPGERLTLKLMMRILSLNDKQLAMRLMRNKIIKSA